MGMGALSTQPCPVCPPDPAGDAAPQLVTLMKLNWCVCQLSSDSGYVSYRIPARGQRDPRWWGQTPRRCWAACAGGLTPLCTPCLCPQRCAAPWGHRLQPVPVPTTTGRVLACTLSSAMGPPLADPSPVPAARFLTVEVPIRQRWHHVLPQPLQGDDL